jgi:hypothetical protein
MVAAREKTAEEAAEICARLGIPLGAVIDSTELYVGCITGCHDRRGELRPVSLQKLRTFKTGACHPCIIEKQAETYVPCSGPS